VPRGGEGEEALDPLGLGYNLPKIVELVNVCISGNSECRLQLKSCRTMRSGLVIFSISFAFQIFDIILQEILSCLAELCMLSKVTKICVS
jgi:hypothetical protein